MPQVVRSALVQHSAEAMYQLVNDVEHYPEFLPGCTETKIVSESAQQMRASVLIAKSGISQWFTTDNSLEPGKSITMQLVNGPFSQLSGGWTFTPLAEDACKVELNLDFEFSNKIVAMAFGKVFSSIASKMVDAFVQRAGEVYCD
ncbi:type II toxin-antitoxin system RatA family toxin [Neptunicella sp. SCSIO 80796]|uniref:type II toxin-antitoxin system RatA family toxin n=1 Tax=Neptunicella plasticusilytica TaxID=3117012 RepID=UPI003A4DE71D